MKNSSRWLLLLLLVFCAVGCGRIKTTREKMPVLVPNAKWRPDIIKKSIKDGGPTPRFVRQEKEMIVHRDRQTGLYIAHEPEDWCSDCDRPMPIPNHTNVP